MAHEHFDAFDKTHAEAGQRNGKEPAMPLSLAGKAIAAAIAVGSLGAFELAPPDTRGQTVFLERLAQRMGEARVIAPDTAARISDVLARVRAQRPHGSAFDPRRAQAIARIEGALLTKTSLGGAAPAAQSSPVARR
jgi:hypothetical protein